MNKCLGEFFHDWRLCESWNLNFHSVHTIISAEFSNYMGFMEDHEEVVMEVLVDPLKETSGTLMLLYLMLAFIN